MYVGATLVTLLVTALMLVPFLRRRERPGEPQAVSVGRRRRAAGPDPDGARSLRDDRRPRDARLDGAGPALRRCHRLSLLVGRCPTAAPTGARPLSSANELRLPVGEPVELFLRANDVIHCFWVPSLAGKTDMIPGRINRMVIQADRPGIYRGQCAEYCGLQHSLMAFDVIAMPRAEFDAWLAELAQPAREPQTPELRAGPRPLRQPRLRRLPRGARRVARPGSGRTSRRSARGARSAPERCRAASATSPAGSRAPSTSSPATPCRPTTSSKARSCVALAAYLESLK